MSQVIKLDSATLNRLLLGYDNLFSDFEQRFAGQVQTNYPPYNVVKTGDNTYELRIAVTGFYKDEIAVEYDQNQLIITGVSSRVEDADTMYLHRGLATRDFQKVFPLADHMEVQTGSIRNGILTVYLKRIVPESQKLRKVEISGE